MDYGIWTLLPIVVVVAVALKSRRALEPLILGTLLTYIIVDGLSFPIGWMDAFFPGGHRPEPPVGVHGVRPVRRADRPAGRLPRDAGLLPAAGSALPGPQDHADCDLGHGDSDLCGRLSEYHDPEHLHAQAHRPAEGAPGDPVLHHRLHRRAGVRPAALLHLGGVLCRAVLRRGGHPGAGLRERHQHLLRRDPLRLLRHRGGGAGTPVLPGAGAQAGADEEGLSPGGGDRKGLLPPRAPS